jgi:hypothetical protein
MRACRNGPAAPPARAHRTGSAIEGKAFQPAQLNQAIADASAEISAIGGAMVQDQASPADLQQ